MIEIREFEMNIVKALKEEIANHKSLLKEAISGRSWSEANQEEAVISAFEDFLERVESK